MNATIIGAGYFNSFHEQLGEGDYQARVQVCVPGLSSGDRCKEYPDSTLKPIGLLQEYGDTERMMTLSRGCEPFWMNDTDAATLGIATELSLDQGGQHGLECRARGLRALDPVLAHLAVRPDPAHARAPRGRGTH